MREHSEIRAEIQQVAKISDQGALGALIEELAVIDSPLADADVENARGFLNRSQGNFDVAMGHFTNALERYKQLDSDLDVAHAHLNIGLTYNSKNDPRPSLDHYDKALELYTALNDLNGIARVTCNIGLAYDHMQDGATAFEYYNRSLSLAREIDDLNCVATNLGNLSHVYQARGESTEALRCLHEALDISISLGDRRGEASHLDSIGVVNWDAGNYPTALEYFQQALQINIEIGNKWGQAVDTGNSANTYAAMGEREKALEGFSQALQLHETMGNKRAIAHMHGHLASVNVALENFETALYHLGIAEQLNRELKIASYEHESLRFRIRSLINLGRIDEAQAIIDRAATVPFVHQRSELHFLSASAYVLEAQNDLEEAVKKLNAAMELADSLNLPLNKQEIHKSLRDIAFKRNDLVGYVQHNNECQRINEEIAGKKAAQQLATMEAERGFEKERIERNREQAVLHATLPKHVAERVIRGEEVSDHLDNASVLFLDITDFTTLSSSMNAKQVSELLNHVFRICDDACNRNGSLRVKTIGDSYMAFAEEGITL